MLLLSGLVDIFHYVITQSFGLYRCAGKMVGTFNYEF